MEKKLPIYYATINEDLNGLELKQQGIQNIALVDSPAMLTEWLMFSEHKHVEFKMALQEEQRIITAPVIIADLPIYRKVENEEFYVVYKKDTNMQILQKYMSDGNQKKVKLTHDTQDLSKGVFVFEIFMSDESRGITAPKGFENLSDGTIYCSMKVNNDAIWKEAKAGKVNGISLEGFFDLEKEIDLDEKQIESIIYNLIKK
jgi:dTDP-glucose pyrophosphorylase